jgi:replicative DNA helicase
MLIDVVLLRIMKHRDDYQKLIRSVPKNALDAKTKALLDDFGKYFTKFPEHDTLDLQVFLPRFKQWHPSMTDETFNSYSAVLRNIKEDVDESTRAGILAELYELDLATSIANVCSQYDQGDLALPISDVISAKIDEYKMNIGAKAVMWNNTDIEDLLKEDLDESGIRWRLNSLNECMRPMRPGDFGIIAGRPDKGKTTFLSSEATFQAKQLPPDRNIIWLNNEGMSGRIVKRLYQSALGVSITELVEMNKGGKLKKMYIDAIGRLDRIRVIDIHGMHVGQVEAIIEQSDPGIVIYDMIDNIRGFGSEARTDLALEEMYKWARERSVKYSCIGLATSQISAEGDGLQFPGLSMLKDSKTGKQGACDFQLMIGASNDPNLEYSRFLSLPKNKLRKDGAPGDPRCEVKFKPTIARYEDVEDGS